MRENKENPGIRQNLFSVCNRRLSGLPRTGFRLQRLFPLFLFLYPLLWANQGIDVSDPLYSLSNFRFFPQLEGSWVLATYLANVTGWLLMKLPFGSTLLGMNLYTRLFISAMALLSYYFLKGKMPAWAAFLGEVIAVSYCWCPSTILYNYLTYFLFLGGCILLYRGLIWGRHTLLVCAGICLGLNVMVRTPNIVEAILILAVFYYGSLTGQKAKEIWKNTGCCVAGFLIGFLAVFAVICLQYGPGAYFEMFAGLSGYTATDESYSPLSMVTSVLAAYGGTLVWVMVLGVCLLAGIVFFRYLPPRLILPGKILYCLCIPVLIRLFWGRGMFTFTYYNYRSIYEWGMLLLYLVLIGCVLMLADAGCFRRDRLLAMIVLLSVIATPIGSNNDTMPNLNNLFLAAPFALWSLSRTLGRRHRQPEAFPALALTAALVAMICVQGVLFRACFAFGDGIYGEKRDTKVSNSAILVGMKTRADNAADLEGLIGFMEENTGEEKLIAFGNAPGLHYLLDKEPALSHGWPDLDTCPAKLMERELEQLAVSGQRLPTVIVYKENGRLPEGTEKWELLCSFMKEKNYTLIYENEGYQVFGTGRNAGDAREDENDQI